MELQIWSKSEDKWAYLLVLKGVEVHLLKVTGNMLTLKRNVQKVLDGLQAGQEPAAVGAKSIKTLDVTRIAKAEIAPGKGSLTLHGEGEGAPNIDYSTGDSNADVILKSILERAGRTFEPRQEEIGVVEALIPPIFVGALCGLFWGLTYNSATKLAAGEEVEVKGRRQGVQKLLLSVADTLGTNGTIAVGVVLLVLILGWAIMRIVKRPERTVWLPVKV